MPRFRRTLSRSIAALAALAASAAAAPARASEPLSLSIFDLQADALASPVVVERINAEIRKRTKKVPGYAVGDKVTMPLADLLRTVGCTTASVGCMAEVAGTVLAARRLLTGEVRAAAGGSVVVLLRVLDVDAGRYWKMTELRGSPDVIVAGLEDALRFLLHVPPPPLLKVITAAEGAEVHVDGVRLGFAPITIGGGIPPGKRVVKVTKPGFVDFQQTVALTIGTTALVEAAMTPR